MNHSAALAPTKLDHIEQERKTGDFYQGRLTLTRIIRQGKRMIRATLFDQVVPDIRSHSSKVAETLGRWELNAVHHADCMMGIKDIPANSIDIAVTSPPYWGQRGSGGLGSETDPREYVKHLSEALGEVMRCLKPSGTLWLNIGDSYNTPINWREDDYAYSSLGKDGNGLDPNNSAYTKNRG